MMRNPFVCLRLSLYHFRIAASCTHVCMHIYEKWTAILWAFRSEWSLQSFQELRQRRALQSEWTSCANSNFLSHPHTRCCCWRSPLQCLCMPLRHHERDDVVDDDDDYGWGSLEKKNGWFISSTARIVQRHNFSHRLHSRQLYRSSSSSSSSFVSEISKAVERSHQSIHTTPREEQQQRWKTYKK